MYQGYLNNPLLCLKYQGLLFLRPIFFNLLSSNSKNHSHDDQTRMAAEDVLKLFDTYWFERTIITENPNPSTVLDSERNPILEIHENSQEPCKVTSLPSTPFIRSLSDQDLSSITRPAVDSCSPNSVLSTPRLQTVVSGEEITEFHQTENFVEEENTATSIKIKRQQERRGKMVVSKSLSDLESEELKGFMDLGFVFSEEDRDSSLVSIIPGLQRLGREEEKKKDQSMVQRPYLSEAWIGLDRKKDNPLKNWRIPDLGDESDMKARLRSWAHTVASTVR